MSKKTPKNEKAKTKSALKYALLLAIPAAILAIVFLPALNSRRDKTAYPPDTCLQVENNCFELEVADTDEKRMKGLSDRNVLPKTQGMLFVFRQAEEQCFWMKDMRFSLDIIWTNEHKIITKIKKNVSPDTYPVSFCGDDSKYVLEFSRGFADKYGLKPGTKLQF